MDEVYLKNSRYLFSHYQSIGERTLIQLDDEQLFWQFNAESNSIAILIQHLSGNMLSRWSDFLHSDGEKEDRDRDAEFEGNKALSREQLMAQWTDGWNCLFTAIDALTVDDLNKTIKIRGENHSVVEAINRQIGHYSYHVGQIVLIGKMLANDNWTSLTIPKGKSNEFNASKKK